MCFCDTQEICEYIIFEMPGQVRSEVRVGLRGVQGSGHGVRGADVGDRADARRGGDRLQPHQGEEEDQVRDLGAEADRDHGRDLRPHPRVQHPQGEEGLHEVRQGSERDLLHPGGSGGQGCEGGYRDPSRAVEQAQCGGHTTQNPVRGKVTSFLLLNDNINLFFRP